MDRKEIKELAKEKIKGNIWNILWPMLVIGFAQAIISKLIGADTTYNLEEIGTVHISTATYIKSTIVSLLAGLASAGYIKYILDFVRKGKLEAQTIIDTIKEKWGNILIAEVLVTVILSIAFMLLVVPGIIMSLAYAFVTYLVIDTDVTGSDSLKKSREMMKGYKWDYFVFILSFLGWAILGVLTLGILFIWVAPYITVANTLYYEKLKELK